MAGRGFSLWPGSKHTNTIVGDVQITIPLGLDDNKLFD